MNEPILVNGKEYHQGFFAYKKGMAYNKNPYDKNSLDKKIVGSYNAWKDGWNYANQEDLFGKE